MCYGLGVRHVDATVTIRLMTALRSDGWPSRKASTLSTTMTDEQPSVVVEVLLDLSSRPRTVQMELGSPKTFGRLASSA